MIKKVLDWGKKGAANLGNWMKPVEYFLGAYILLIVISNLIPTLQHGFHNITDALSSVPFVGAVFADGGLIYIILAVGIFAAVVYGFTSLTGKKVGK